MSRLVCDTNCLISGLVWTCGAPGTIIRRLEKRSDVLITSVDLLQEFAEVIQRPKFAAVLSTKDRALALIRRLASLALIVDPYPLPSIVVEADPDDDMVLACAATAHPDFIISGDGHLLDLQAFEAIPILSPRDYLDQLEGIRKAFRAWVPGSKFTVQGCLRHELRTR